MLQHVVTLVYSNSDRHGRHGEHRLFFFFFLNFLFAFFRDRSFRKNTLFCDVRYKFASYRRTVAVGLVDGTDTYRGVGLNG